MKRFFAFLLMMAMLFTACGSQPAEKYPPQKMDFGDGNYSWHYFDDKGQRIKYESYKKDVLTEIHYIEFDEDGNKVKETTTDPDGNELSRTETTWKDNKRSYEVRYKNGLMSVEDFYDKNENVYLSKSYDKGVLYSWTESFYDENNSAIISVGYRADGTARWMNEYSEDADGNFVTQTSEYSENEELLKITRRTSTKNGFREEILFEK